MTLSLAATLLILAAVSLGGYLVFVGIRRRKRIPKLGFSHAGMALAGTTMLAMQIVSDTSDKLNNAAVLFLVLALIGGGMVFMLHEKGRPPSMPVVIIHAAMGFVGLILLVINL